MFPDQTLDGAKKLSITWLRIMVRGFVIVLYPSKDLLEGKSLCLCSEQAVYFEFVIVSHGVSFQLRFPI